MEASSYNQWKEIIKFFNTKVGQEVTRKELRAAIIHRRRNDYPETVDNYRMLLENAGYIDHTGTGIYFVKKQIPDISSSLVKEFLDRKNKPYGWFKFWGMNTLDDYIEWRKNEKEINNNSETLEKS